MILNRFKKNKVFICAFLTACYTGMRTGEVFALTWDDIGLDNRIININKTVYAQEKEESGRWYLGTTKTSGSKRYPFKIIHHELGINCRFYDLRGSFVTKALRNGNKIKDISKLLGHSRIEATENYYITSTANDLIKICESIEKEIDINLSDKF